MLEIPHNLPNMECSVCYSDDAAAPSCGHPVCQGCTTQMLKHNLVACPLCRKTMDTPGVKEHDLYLKACREGNPERAAELYTTAAKLGHPTAMFNIGVLHAKGLGLPQNIKKAMRWWRKASRRGFAKAMYNRGVIFSMNGDQARARHWYLKGAKNGCEMAAYRVGVILHCDKKYARAARWLHKSSLNGYGLAQTALAEAYRNALGVPKDDKRAFYWFRKASYQGVLSATTALARMYADGDGAPKNSAKALRLFLRAARKGVVEAQLQVARMYREQNSNKAAYWERRARADRKF
jgi:TPR repeat protein